VRRFALSVLAAFAFLRFLSWKRTKAAPATASPASEPVAPPEPETDPRAEELRAKLEAREDPAAAEPEPETVPEPDERRRSVHERGRHAVEQMRDSSSGE
jgi:hypothetical protein